MMLDPNFEERPALNEVEQAREAGFAAGLEDALAGHYDLRNAPYSAHEHGILTQKLAQSWYQSYALGRITGLRQKGHK